MIELICKLLFWLPLVRISVIDLIIAISSMPSIAASVRYNFQRPLSDSDKNESYDTTEYTFQV